MCFSQKGDISTLNNSSLKLWDKFIYLGSSVSSIKTDVNMQLAKAWTAIDWVSVIWKSDLTDKIEHSFLEEVVSILLYGCTTWTLTKPMEKLYGNYTRMLWAILNKSWRKHPTKQQLYGHLPPIMKTIQVRQTRYAGHCWRHKDKLVSNILLWTPLHGWAKAGQPARTYIGYSVEDLLGAMDNRDGCQERVREIHANTMISWWCVCMCVYIYIYCHLQTDCFVLSELFSVARHAGHSKPGSEPI